MTDYESIARAIFEKNGLNIECDIGAQEVWNAIGKDIITALRETASFPEADLAAHQRWVALSASQIKALEAQVDELKKNLEFQTTRANVATVDLVEAEKRIKDLEQTMINQATMICSKSKVLAQTLREKDELQSRIRDLESNKEVNDQLAADNVKMDKRIRELERIVHVCPTCSALSKSRPEGGKQ